MAFLNRVQLIGNVGQDPELRRTSSGTPVTTLRIATNHHAPDADGKMIEHTEWHNVVVWARQAELCAQYLSKGRTVFVEGRLHTRSWDDAGGQKKWATEVVASRVQFLGGAPVQSAFADRVSEFALT